MLLIDKHSRMCLSTRLHSQVVHSCFGPASPLCTTVHLIRSFFLFPLPVSIIWLVWWCFVARIRVHLISPYCESRQKLSETADAQAQNIDLLQATLVHLYLYLQTLLSFTCLISLEYCGSPWCIGFNVYLECPVNTTALKDAMHSRKTQTSKASHLRQTLLHTESQNLSPCSFGSCQNQSSMLLGRNTLKE